MSSRPGIALAILLAITPQRGWAQACCAAPAGITPGRLMLHEQALVGVQVKSAVVVGSFDRRAEYVASPTDTSELDLEQDLVGSLRLVSNAQLTLDVPVVQTWRRTPGISEWGGGIGDVIVGGRYDFFLAGQSRWIPGIALLLGATLPTGRPTESARHPLATDATGVGAAQGSLGIALEQRAGAFLFGATAVVSKRAARSVQGLRVENGARGTVLASAAYALNPDAAVGAFVVYTAEGRATIDGKAVPDSASYSVLSGVSAALSPVDGWRFQALASFTPMLQGFGRNCLATWGFALMGMKTWS